MISPFLHFFPYLVRSSAYRSRIKDPGSKIKDSRSADLRSADLRSADPRSEDPGSDLRSDPRSDLRSKDTWTKKNYDPQISDQRSKNFRSLDPGSKPGRSKRSFDPGSDLFFLRSFFFVIPPVNKDLFLPPSFADQGGYIRISDELKFL
tara:strand:- start:238 stop:684 length:447 start_codon:yes stop_codon:yes gene_type:complete